MSAAHGYYFNVKHVPQMHVDPEKIAQGTPIAIEGKSKEKPIQGRTHKLQPKQTRSSKPATRSYFQNH